MAFNWCAVVVTVDIGVKRILWTDSVCIVIANSIIHHLTMHSRPLQWQYSKPSTMGNDTSAYAHTKYKLLSIEMTFYCLVENSNFPKCLFICRLHTRLSIVLFNWSKCASDYCSVFGCRLHYRNTENVFSRFSAYFVLCRLCLTETTF